MVGDYKNSKVGDLVHYHTSEKSFEHLNGIYMILKRTKGMFDLIRIDEISLGDFDKHGFVDVSNVNADSKNVHLIKMSDIKRKFKSPEYF